MLLGVHQRVNHVSICVDIRQRIAVAVGGEANEEGAGGLATQPANGFVAGDKAVEPLDGDHALHLGELGAHLQRFHHKQTNTHRHTMRAHTHTYKYKSGKYITIRQRLHTRTLPSTQTAEQKKSKQFPYILEAAAQRAKPRQKDAHLLRRDGADLLVHAKRVLQVRLEGSEIALQLLLKRDVELIPGHKHLQSGGK